MVPISWMRTSDAFPDLARSDTDFAAFDREKIIRRVCWIAHGTQGRRFIRGRPVGPARPVTERGWLLGDSRPERRSARGEIVLIGLSVR